MIVPFAGDCQHRRAAWQHLKRLYRWPVIEATPPAASPWVKALAVMPAIAASSAEVVVVADADCWSDGLGAAVTAVECGWPWAIPHDHVHRLSEAATTRVLGGQRWEGQELAEQPYRGVPGGGFVVAPRETLLRVPLDPRFEGWGQEDASWAIALGWLCGPGWRGSAPLVHLWHPPQRRQQRKLGSMAGWRLQRRYARARRSRAELSELVAEARRLLAPSLEEARCDIS